MTPLALLVLLGVLITVHELGHFIVAKLAGVRVLTFSLGFGPKLVRFRRGETEYCISALPLGGYVRMYGDDAGEEVPAHEKHYAFLEKPWLVKSAIAIAGPVANLLLPVALFFAIHVGDERVGDAVVGSVLAGEPASAAGVRPGDRVVAVDDVPVVAFGDLVTAIAPRAGQATQLTLERPGPGGPSRLQVTLTPSSAKSPDPTATAPVGRIGLLATRELPLVVVAKDSDAAKAGLQTGDRVKQVNGVDVADRAALDAALDAAVAPAAPAAPAAPVVLVVERAVNGAATTITVTVPGATTAPATAPATAPTTATALEDVTDPPAPAEALAPTPAPVDVATLRFAVVEEDLADQGLQARVSSTRDVVIAAVRRQQAMRGIAGYEGLVVAVEEESPAGARAVKPREHRIVAVDGAPLRVASDLSLALQKDVDAIHVVGVVDGAGRGATFAFRMQKSTRRELGGARILGVGLASAHGDAAMIERHVGVGEAFRRAVDESLQSARVVLSGYWMLFTGRVGLDQIGGPVLIANIAGEAARAGLEVFVATMCLVSMNLAFLNLLPVPVLDGGHLLLFTIEAVRGRKLSSEARLKATRIGLLFVGALMLVALLNDFLSLVS